MANINHPNIKFAPNLINYKSLSLLQVSETIGVDFCEDRKESEELTLQGRKEEYSQRGRLTMRSDPFSETINLDTPSSTLGEIRTDKYLKENNRVFEFENSLLKDPRRTFVSDKGSLKGSVIEKKSKKHRTESQEICSICIIQ